MTTSKQAPKVLSTQRTAMLKPQVNAPTDLKISVADTFHFIEQRKLVLKQISQGKETNFKFDRVFNDTHTQDDIYDEVKDVVRSALDGQNVCIFAYG